MESNTDNIFNDIQELQKVEKKLFYDLEQYGISDTEKNKIIENINKVTEMRINLYELLIRHNFFLRDNVIQSNAILNDQETAIDIVEKELNQAKNRLSNMRDEKLNKMRLVQLNRYYSDRYYEHANLLKILVFTMIPILIILLLFKKELIPLTIFYILFTIISVIGGVYFIKQLYSMMSRNNMNYREFDWQFDSSNAPKNSAAPPTNKSDPWTSINLGTCVGQFCCSTNTVYDALLNQCVPEKDSNNKVVPTTTNRSSIDINTLVSGSVNNSEGFTPNFLDNFLNKYAYSYNKPDVTLDSVVEPSLSKSFILS